MKKIRTILVVGSSAVFGVSLHKTLTDHCLSTEDVIVVTSDNTEECTKQSPFASKPIKITAQHLPLGEYTPTRAEIESYHPFSKFMGKKKRW